MEENNNNTIIQKVYVTQTSIQDGYTTKHKVKKRLLELYPNTAEKIDLKIEEAIKEAQVTCEISTTNKNELMLIKILLDEGNYYYAKWENGLKHFVEIYLYKGKNIEQDNY